MAGLFGSEPQLGQRQQFPQNSQPDVQQLLAVIIEMIRRASGGQQGQGQQTQQTQALPPDAISAGGLLGGNFTRGIPTSGTNPLGGIGGRQGIFSRGVEAPSEQDQVLAAIGAFLKNINSFSGQKSQGLI